MALPPGNDRRARLITPEGKTIELSPETYRRIRRIIDAEAHPPSRLEIDRAIRLTYGRLAGGDSLTRALLEERRQERAREDAKESRFKD